MDDLDRDRAAGRAAARDTLLRWILVWMFAEERDPRKSVDHFFGPLLEMFDDTPPRDAEDVGKARAHAISQHGLHYLEQLRAGCLQGLRRSPSPPS